MKQKILSNNLPFIKPAIMWQWTDIAICLRVYKQSNFANYNIGVDIQILFFNLWIQCFRKHTKQNGTNSFLIIK